MTRIIGGEVGGRRLKAPPGSATRPTSDRVREALFSALESQLGTLAGLRFLDLYAGSGAVGLEARSRGASAVTLVEHDRSAATLIRANAKALGLSEVEVLGVRAEKAVTTAPSGGPFDVVFVDPPYPLPSSEVAETLTRLASGGWLAAEALLVVERSSRDAWEWPHGFEALRSKRYGETTLWYGRHAMPNRGGAHA